MSESSQIGPLADLERRWEQERSAQLTLKLAEEHRRLGNLGRGLEVLRQGLEHNPGHVAARVALGRFLFEDGQTDAAIVALESVVDDDPTHLVANKLLVSACLEAGNRERARNRLGLYKLLNASDADIEELERKVEAPEADAEEDAPSPEDGDGPDSSLEEGPSDEEIADASRREDVVDRAPAESASSSSEPFGDIWSVADQSYRSALAAEGIFQVADRLPAEDLEPAAEELEEPDLEQPGATVTLGRLYLEQGHAEEAEAIFRAVLEADPGNADAEQGIREALGAGSELKAADLVEPEVLAEVDVSERKRLVLESYRSRLRAGSAKS